MLTATPASTTKQYRLAYNYLTMRTSRDYYIQPIHDGFLLRCRRFQSLIEVYSIDNGTLWCHDLLGNDFIYATYIAMAAYVETYQVMEEINTLVLAF
jgi:hypothetical protein